MTTREDVELLRLFARNTPNEDAIDFTTQICEARAVLGAVARLYSAELSSAPHAARLAKIDIKSVRIALAKVPMTVEQREHVESRLGMVETSVDHEAVDRDGWVWMKRGLLEDLRRELHGSDWEDSILSAIRMARNERPAEDAIESITNEIGVHNYQDAARAVIVAWRTMMTLHGIFCTKTAAQLIRVAKGDHVASSGGAWILGVKRKWGAWDDEDPEAKAQQRVIDTLRAMRESMDEPLTDAMDETIGVLEHMLGTIPF